MRPSKSLLPPAPSRRALMIASTDFRKRISRSRIDVPPGRVSHEGRPSSVYRTHLFVLAKYSVWPFSISVTTSRAPPTSIVLEITLKTARNMSRLTARISPVFSVRHVMTVASAEAVITCPFCTTSSCRNNGTTTPLCQRHSWPSEAFSGLQNFVLKVTLGKFLLTRLQKSFDRFGASKKSHSWRSRRDDNSFLVSLFRNDLQTVV